MPGVFNNVELAGRNHLIHQLNFGGGADDSLGVDYRGQLSPRLGDLAGRLSALLYAALSPHQAVG